MKPSRVASSVVFCFIGVGLAACPDDNRLPAPQAVSQDRSVETPPLSDQRSAVVRGEIPVDVGDRVFFAFDSSALSQDAQRTLQRQAAWVNHAGPQVLTIEGHADERGTREYNLALGERRANVVRDYLIAQGVPTDRLRTVSYGKERPQLAGHDAAAWAQNRRAVSVPQ